MIRVRLEDGRFEVHGHAKRDEGEDFAEVCAASSMMAYTMAFNLLERVDEGEITLEQPKCDDGCMEFRWRDKFGNARDLVRAIFVGYQLLADKYPQHVRLDMAQDGEHPDGAATRETGAVGSG